MEGERERVRRAAVSFFFPKHNTHPDTHSPSGLQRRPIIHLRFWLGPPPVNSLGLQSSSSGIWALALHSASKQFINFPRRSDPLVGVWHPTRCLL